MLSRLAERKLVWIRTVLVLGWAVIILGLLVDPKLLVINGVYPLRKLTTIIWSVLIPLIPIFLLVFGHEAWRRICPLSSIMQIPRWLGVQFRKREFNTRTGKIDSKLNLISSKDWLGNHFWSIQYGLLIIAILCRLLFLNTHNVALGIFFCALILILICVGFVFGGKSWCHYLCPISPVQKLYSEPGGLLESKNYEFDSKTPKSMCRTSSEKEDVSTCVGCKTHCSDIDLEKQYWEELNISGRKWVSYSFSGLVLGFFHYYFWYSGSWDFYFSGGQVSLSNSVSGDLLQPGFFFNSTIPKWAAVPITLIVYMSFSFLVWFLFEKLFIRWTRWRKKSISREVLQHNIYCLISFVSFNLFYHYAGQPVLRFTAVEFQYSVHMLLVIVSVFWLHKSWYRSPEIYHKESLSKTLMRQLAKLPIDFSKLLDGRLLQDLKADEVYILAKTLPEISRDQKLNVYRETMRDLLEKGQVNSLESLFLLADIRNNLGVSEAEHLDILLSLGVEDQSLFDPKKHQDDRERTVFAAFSDQADALLLKCMQGELAASQVIQSPEFQIQLDKIRSLYSINDLQLQRWLAKVGSEKSPLLEQLNNLFKRIKAENFKLKTIKTLSRETNGQYVMALLRGQWLRTMKLLDEYINLSSHIDDKQQASFQLQCLYRHYNELFQNLIEHQQLEECLPSITHLSPEQMNSLLSLEENSINKRIDCFFEQSNTSINEALLELANDIDPFISLYAVLILKDDFGVDLFNELLQRFSTHWFIRGLDRDSSSFTRVALHVPYEFNLKINEQSETRCLTKLPVFIGSESHCDWRISHRDILPIHCQIYSHAGEVWIKPESPLARIKDHQNNPVEQMRCGINQKIHLGSSVILTRLHVESPQVSYQLLNVNRVGILCWLLGFELFNNLDLSSMARFTEVTEVRFYPKNTFLCRLNDNAHEMFLLYRGKLSVEKTIDGVVHQLSEIPAGQPVGELAAITGGNRSSDVKVTEDSVVISVSGEKLDRLLSQDAITCKKMLKTVSQRLQDTLAQQHF